LHNGRAQCEVSQGARDRRDLGRIHLYGEMPPHCVAVARPKARAGIPARSVGRLTALYEARRPAYPPAWYPRRPPLLVYVVYRRGGRLGYSAEAMACLPRNGRCGRADCRARKPQPIAWQRYAC